MKFKSRALHFVVSLVCKNTQAGVASFKEWPNSPVFWCSGVLGCYWLKWVNSGSLKHGKTNEPLAAVRVWKCPN